MSIHRYLTKYGLVFHSDTCKDDWRNIVTANQWRKLNGTLIDRIQPLKLQQSAMRSVKAVEKKLGRQVISTGTWRSCSEQAHLYAEDPKRYANPNTTLHTQGLAIDVNTEYLDEHIRKALLNHGWHQVRPDEPWHFSYKLSA